MRHKGWTYIIYDEKEGDVPVFEADTIDEIARWLDMEKRVVVCEVCRGCLIRRRYRASPRPSWTPPPSALPS